MGRVTIWAGMRGLFGGRLTGRGDLGGGEDGCCSEDVADYNSVLARGRCPCSHLRIRECIISI